MQSKQPCKPLLRLLTAVIYFIYSIATPSLALETRLKDIAVIEGVRDNMLVGYGLVVGLDGTGDQLNNTPFTKQSVEAMLQRLGVSIQDSKIRTKNVAAVLVTADLPPFSRKGRRTDVNVSAIGDATSLVGGTLLVTPLLGADGEVYAVAQGMIIVSGYKAVAKAASIVQGTPTAGRVVSGAMVEKEVPFDFGNQNNIVFTLHNPDFTTASRVSQVINKSIGNGLAQAMDSSAIKVTIPPAMRNNIVSFITKVEQLKITPDNAAKVVIDEASGTIVVGADVRVSNVAIAQGNLTIKIAETPQVSQPNGNSPFGGANNGITKVMPRSSISVDEDAGNKIAVLNTGVTLQSLVNGLNALGASPRDLISILQVLEHVGALQANIEIM